MSSPNKPFMIDKRRVYEAYLQVRSKDGAAGGDGVTIEQFEADLKSNLYENLKSNEFWSLLPAASARRLHSEEEWRSTGPRSAHRS